MDSHLLTNKLAGPIFTMTTTASVGWIATAENYLLQFIPEPLVNLSRVVLAFIVVVMGFLLYQTYKFLASRADRERVAAALLRAQLEEEKTRRITHIETLVEAITVELHELGKEHVKITTLMAAMKDDISALAEFRVKVITDLRDFSNLVNNRRGLKAEDTLNG